MIDRELIESVRKSPLFEELYDSDEKVLIYYTDSYPQRMIDELREESVVLRLDALGESVYPYEGYTDEEKEITYNMTHSCLQEGDTEGIEEWLRGIIEDLDFEESHPDRVEAQDLLQMVKSYRKEMSA